MCGGYWKFFRSWGINKDFENPQYYRIAAIMAYEFHWSPTEIKKMDAGLTSPSPAFEWTGAMVGKVAVYASADPARQFNTLQLTGITAPAEANRRTYTEKNTLVWDGIALHRYNVDGTVSIMRLLTSYQTNGVGAPDPSYLDANTLFVLQAIMQTTVARMETRFPRHKLAPDSTRPGGRPGVATPADIRAECVALARLWEQYDWIKNIEDFKDNLQVEINASDPNRVDIILPPDIIGNLRVGAIKVLFGL